MSIQVEKWTKAIEEAKSISELYLVLKTMPSIDNYSQELYNKILEVPCTIHEDFIILLSTAAQGQGANSNYTNSTLFNLLKTYCNRILQCTELNLFAVRPDVGAIILISGNDFSKVNRDWIRQTCDYLGSTDVETYSIYNDDQINTLFINKDYSLTNSVFKDMPPEAMRVTASLISVFTSTSAYEEEVGRLARQFTRLNECTNLWKRAQLIYEKYIRNNQALSDRRAVDLDDITTAICYMMASYRRILSRVKDTTITPTLFNSCFEDFYNSVEFVLSQITLPNEKIWVSWHIAIVFDVIKEASLLLHNEAIIDKFVSMITFVPTNTFDIKICRKAPESPVVSYYKNPPEITLEAYTKSSNTMDTASRKIYAGYKSYKDAENKVDSQLTKLVLALKSQFTKSARDKVVEGDQLSVVKIIKKVLSTAAIFSYSKVGGVLYLITKHYVGNKVTKKEKQSLILTIETELKLIDEKIDDARGDGNRAAKYDLMRTKAELEKALDSLKYGLTADEKIMNTARSVASGKKSTSYTTPRE